MAPNLFKSGKIASNAGKSRHIEDNVGISLQIAPYCSNDANNGLKVLKGVKKLSKSIKGGEKA